MLVLGIESSCDETGVALVEAANTDVPVLLSHALHSQIDMHQAYGGVVPELASRDHIRRVLPLATQVMNEAGAARWPRWTWWPTPAAPVWPGRCWWGRAWPALWVRRWTSLSLGSTTWKGICFRPL
jgi:hypothetical protein